MHSQNIQSSRDIHADPSLRLQPSVESSAFRKGLVIHLNSENGLTEAMTLPLIKPRGTGPKYLESRDATKLSPTIQQWPCGTWHHG
jgi:hypothetical protein